jgi:hypothetical protein
VARGGSGHRQLVVRSEGEKEWGSGGVWEENGGCRLRGAAQRKEEGRSPGSIVPHGGGWHRGAGSRQGVRPVEAMAGRAYATRAGEWGQRVWAARERVGRPGEGMSGAGPERTVPILIYSKEFQLIRFVLTKR